jgi:hypothetical protein
VIDAQNRPAPESAARVAGAVFLIALTLLAFELVVTRLFSVILWNHFAFLAISIALFGLGAAGIAVHVLPGWFSAERAVQQIRAFSLLLALVLWIVVPGLCALPIRMDFTRQMMGYLGTIFVLAALPFAIGGIAITLALKHWPRHTNRIYAFDLVGSGVGCLVVILLLELLDGPSAALALAVFPAAAALVLRRSWWLALLVAALACGAAVNAREQLVRIHVGRSNVLEPIFERWNAFSQVTVTEVGEWRGWWVSPERSEPAVPILGIQIDADAFTPMLAYDGDLSKVAVVLADLTSVAYHVAADAESALVIGAGGGKDVLTALASGVKHVRAVELNPIIAEDIVSGAFRDFTGDLYSDPRVELVIGEGRTVVRHDPSSYDIIQLSMVDTSAASAAGAFALTENSLYTLEAAQEFLGRLRPGGVLTSTWMNFPTLQGVNRLVALYAEALRRQGFSKVADRIAVVGAPTLHRWRLPLATMIVRPSGFSGADASFLRELCERYDFLPLYIPGDPFEAGVRWDVDVIRRILSEVELESFYDSHSLDLRPVTDDRPFFFYQNRLRDAPQALFEWNPGPLYGNGQFILVKLMLISVVAVLLFMGLPLLLALWRGTGWLRGSGPFVLYFACLGVGFIVLEIALVQMFGYYLGHPLLGLGVSLTSLLLLTGIGSALGSRWPDDRVLARIPRVLLAVIALSLVYVVLLPPLLAHTLGWVTGARAALVVVVVAPLGLMLGMPFPSGLRILPDREQQTPWMWAINAAASVLGATFATMVVMNIGFSSTLVVGALVYAGALASVLAVRSQLR